ncbi:hypothetical protein HYQ46_009219 [Verticillium longisporum]|nr:hypothetical protein HYQ46_009219 [Verticillium longisporum]
MLLNSGASLRFRTSLRSLSPSLWKICASEIDFATDGDNMELDDDETHTAIVSRQKLAELFDAAPAFAMPSIEDMFYKVTGLLTTKPLASTAA